MMFRNYYIIFISLLHEHVNIILISVILIPFRGTHNGGGLFSSVTQPCPTLCDSMDCSTQVFPVHHQLPELTQTHVHKVGDAIQPSHPFPPAFNLSQIRVFFNESALPIRWLKYWSFSFSVSPSNEYSGLIS